MPEIPACLRFAAENWREITPFTYDTSSVDVRRERTRLCMHACSVMNARRVHGSEGGEIEQGLRVGGCMGSSARYTPG